MENRRSRALLCLWAIVGLAAYLRLLGITWGANSGYSHYLNFQPDEYISMRGMLPIQPLAGRIKAPGAYFEGTFNYYLWAAPEVLHSWATGAPPITGEDVPVDRAKFILLAGRLMTMAFDLATLLVLYAIIAELTAQYAAALLGAFFYAIFPMQVIYAHFMRTHPLSNLLCACVIWLSLKALKYRRWWLFGLAGVISGLAGATRYPIGIILTIPCLFVLFEARPAHEPWYRRVLTAAVYLLSGPLWLLAGGFVLGLFIGEPMLFLDFKGVVQTISNETLHYVPPGPVNPFDLGPLWKYFSVLIPYATYPMLWLLIYLAVFYVLFQRSLWPVALPLCLFTVLYSYPMAKGYIALFARQVMLLLPIGCIFVGLAFAKLAAKISSRPIRLVLLAVLALFIVPTLVFDWAYGRAMQRTDVRDLLRQDLAELTKERSPTTIGVSDRGCYFYTAMPGVFPLNGGNVAVELQTSFNKPADFFVMGSERPLADNWRDLVIRQVEAGGNFSFMKTYSAGPTFLGRKFDLSNFPPDMTYPFPMIFLFRKAATN